MKKYALIGRGIQESLSPIIHSSYGCQYDLLDIGEDQLEWALQQAYDGFNVTSPYKEKILPYLDLTASDVINTIVKKDGKLHGYNTDIYGFKAALVAARCSIFVKIGLLGKGSMAKTLQSILPNSEIIDSYNYSFAGIRGLVNCTPHQVMTWVVYRKRRGSWTWDTRKIHL